MRPKCILNLVNTGAVLHTVRDSCRFCGRFHELGKNNCPAFGAVCRSFNEKNHYDAQCEKENASYRSIKQVSDSFKTVLVLKSMDSGGRIFAYLLVNGKRVRFMTDSGSTIAAISTSIYESLPLRPELLPAKSVLRMLSCLELPTARVIEDEKQLQLKVCVTDHDNPIPDMSDCQELDLLSVMEHNICATEATSPPAIERPSNDADVFARFGDLFYGNLGWMKGLVQLLDLIDQCVEWRLQSNTESKMNFIKWFRKGSSRLSRS